MLPWYINSTIWNTWYSFHSLSLIVVPAYHYTLHTGTKLNAKSVIRISGVAFSFQTLLFLQFSVFLSAAVWPCWSPSAWCLQATGIRQWESCGSSVILSLLFDLPPCNFNPVYLCLYTLFIWTAAVRRNKGFFSHSLVHFPLLCQQGETL